MDAEEISKLVEGLRVSAEARERVVMISSEEAASGQKRIDRVVVGKIFSKKSVNRETLRSNLPRILRTRGTTEIEMVGHNLFVISFALESDKRVALEEGPWHFFQELMILKKTKAMQTPSEVEFDEISLWVQCHNVPLDCMEPDIIKRIGGRVGKVEEVDVGEGGSCLGKFARVRVTRRIDEPLIRCVPLVHETIQKETLVLLQYERLPEFCFICGRVGHISRDCWEDKGERGKFRYESWLRAGRSVMERRHQDNEAGGLPRLQMGRGRELREHSSTREEWRRGAPKSPGYVEVEESSGKRIVSEGGGEREMDDGREEREEGEQGEESEGRGVLQEDLMATEEVAGEGKRSEAGLDTEALGEEMDPGTTKEMSKKGGRSWKRLARAKKGKGDGDQTDPGRGLGLKRRGGVLEKGGGEEGMSQKLIKLTEEAVPSNQQTAEAAAQPRRTL